MNGDHHPRITERPPGEGKEAERKTALEMARLHREGHHTTILTENVNTSIT